MEKRWITGREILTRWNGVDFELLEAFKNGLDAWHINTGVTIGFNRKAQLYVTTKEADSKVTDSELDFTHKADGEKTKDLLDENKFVFLLSSVEEYEEKHGMRQPDLSSNEEPAMEDLFLVSDDSSLDWQDITISFVSDWEIHIQFSDKPGITRRYDQAGFDDKRNGKSIAAWDVFKEAAYKREIPFSFENRKNVEKKAGNIRDRLRRLFPSIPGDPVPIDKKEGVYKFAFRLRPLVD